MRRPLAESRVDAWYDPDNCPRDSGQLNALDVINKVRYYVNFQLLANSNEPMSHATEISNRQLSMDSMMSHHKRRSTKL